MSQPNRPYPTGQCVNSDGIEWDSEQYLQSDAFLADASSFGGQGNCLFPLTVVANGCTCLSGRAEDFYQPDYITTPPAPCK